MLVRTLSVACGGAVGAVFRFWLSSAIHRWLGQDFPYGTLSVNVLGSLLMGFGYVMLVERMDVTPELRGILLIGVLGAFTTFSTFSIETLQLVEAGQGVKAALNVLLSVSLCVLVCWIGLILGRQL